MGGTWLSMRSLMTATVSGVNISASVALLCASSSTRDETARTINSILASQVEKLLVRPIGRVGDLVPEDKVRRAADMLTDRIDAAARERLPAAIAEFDIGRIVEEKVSGYPIKKLEDLVLSVAKQHLRTIELFGLLIGFVIGVVQAAYLYFRLMWR